MTIYDYNYMSKFRNPRFKGPNDTGWQDRHTDALDAPKGPERPIVHMLRAWAEYADEHKTRYDFPIGEDQVLGPEWAAIGARIRGLLNGESGRLDCGTLDSFIVDTLAAEDFGPDEL